MFRVDPALHHVDATREQVVSVIESINHPVVGVPGHPTQVTEAYVVGRRNAGGSFSIFVYLYLTESRDAVVYAHDGELDVESYREMETEALTFVESMGFMVDNVNFRNLSALQQEEVMERLPCFQSDLAAFAARFDVTEDAPAGDEPEVLDLSEAEVLEEVPAAPAPAPAPEPEPAPAPERTLDPESGARVGRLLGSF